MPRAPGKEDAVRSAFYRRRHCDPSAAGAYAAAATEVATGQAFTSF